MAPGTFTGLAFFLASLGPGFVYLRVAGRRRPAPEQSALAEAVEMVVLGASISLLCGLSVLAAVRGFDILDWSALMNEPQEYIADHPFRLLGSLAGALLLSYLLAFLLGLAVHARSPKLVHPGLTMWQQALWRERPSPKHSTLVTAELRDGRTVTGQVRGFTVEQMENRELMLAGELAVQRNPGAPAEVLRDTFIVIRENDLRYVAGRYLAPLPSNAPDHDVSTLDDQSVRDTGRSPRA